MTPERLAQIKEHFKNPPSASCNREWALEMVAELEKHGFLAPPDVAAVLSAPGPSSEPEPLHIPHDAPTPPAAPAAKKRAGK